MTYCRKIQTCRSVGWLCKLALKHLCRIHKLWSICAGLNGWLLYGACSGRKPGIVHVGLVVSWYAMDALLQNSWPMQSLKRNHRWLVESRGCAWFMTGYDPTDSARHIFMSLAICAKCAYDLNEGFVDDLEILHTGFVDDLWINMGK